MSKKDDNKPEKAKNKSALDKLIMGAIIGSAVGTAIGMAAAPKKGSETRKDIVSKASEVSDEAKEVSKLAAETGAGLWKLGKALFKRGKKVVQKKAEEFIPSDNMKEIPHETDVIPEDHVN